MKKRITFFIPLMSAILLFVFAITNMGFELNNNSGNTFVDWEKLGDRKVNQTAESDEINFPSNGPVLTAIKIKSKRGGINLQRCVIYFANGDKKSIELRNDIPPGGESRVINLQGNKQPITKFIYWYGIPQSGDQKADLEIWGKI
jgi:hypothetical protein